MHQGSLSEDLTNVNLDIPPAGFEPVQNLGSDFFEWYLGSSVNFYTILPDVVNLLYLNLLSKKILEVSDSVFIANFGQVFVWKNW